MRFAHNNHSSVIQFPTPPIKNHKETFVCVTCAAEMERARKKYSNYMKEENKKHIDKAVRFCGCGLVNSISSMCV